MCQKWEVEIEGTFLSAVNVYPVICALDKLLGFQLNGLTRQSLVRHTLNLHTHLCSMNQVPCYILHIHKPINCWLKDFKNTFVLRYLVHFLQRERFMIFEDMLEEAQGTAKGMIEYCINHGRRYCRF